MSVNNLEPNPLLSFFSAYQTAYQQAAGLVSLQTLGLPTWLQAPDIPDTSIKQFLMSYEPPQTPNSPLLSVGVLPQIPGVSMPAGPLVFDITLATAPGAIPQRVAYSEIARQTIEQSVVGFHVNEFGLAPGRLDIDAVIVYQGLQYAQVDSFFQFLRQVKTTNPLGQTTAPGQVLFIDVYLQRKLSITLETVMIEEIAGQNNQAHLVMGASILRDYSSPSAANATQSGIPPSASNLEAAAGLLGATLQLQGVSLPI